MTNKRVIEILKCMADGIDPITGEVLGAEHICNYPDVIRALHAAVQSMSVNDEADGIMYARKNGKLNAGRPWTDEERMELERMYQDGMPMSVICEMLQRRERGIRKQLAYLGLIDSGEQPSGNKKPGLERAGLPWTRDEDGLLKDFYSKKFSVAEMSREMHRSEYSIYCRLQKLKLYGEEYGYPSKPQIS